MSSSSSSSSDAPATRDVPGARGLPLLGETPSFVYDVKRFIDERAARYGATFRTHLFGTPTVLTCSYHTAAAALAPPLDAAAAYAPFLRALYPAPNLLLSREHAPPRAAQLPLLRAALRDAARFGERVSALLQPVLQPYCRGGGGGEHAHTAQLRLYATFKPLAWRAINEALLGALDHAQHARIRRLCADHFNGVAALPLAVSAFGSRSARAAALSAYQQLHATLSELLQQRVRALQQQQQSAPPRSGDSSLHVLAAMVHAREAQLADAVQVLLMLLSPAVAKAVASSATIAVALLAEPQRMALQHDVSVELQRGHFHTLDCVLMETLRLYPPLAGAMRAADVDTELTALRVPRGCSVWLSYMHANRDARAFERAQQFEPARWARALAPPTAAAAAAAARAHACPFARAHGAQTPPTPLSFGGGARECGGRDVAWTMLRAMVGDVLRQLRVSGARVLDEQLRYVPVLRPRHDALVRVSARSAA